MNIDVRAKVVSHMDICDEQWFTDAYLNNALVNRAVQFACYKRMGRDEARLYLIQTLISQNEEIQKAAIERIKTSLPAKSIGYAE